MAPLPAVTDTKGRRRNPVPTGRLQDPPCQRCVRGGKGCLKQAGKALPGRSRRACIHCAKIKMCCDNDKSHPAPPIVQDQASGSAKPLVISSGDELSTPPLVKRSQLATKKWLAQAKKGPVATKQRLASRTPLLAPTPASHLAHHLGKGKGKEVAPPITSTDELEDGYLNPHPPP